MFGVTSTVKDRATEMRGERIGDDADLVGAKAESSSRRFCMSPVVQGLESATCNLHPK